MGPNKISQLTCLGTFRANQIGSNNPTDLRIANCLTYRSYSLQLLFPRAHMHPDAVPETGTGPACRGVVDISLAWKTTTKAAGREATSVSSSAFKAATPASFSAFSLHFSVALVVQPSFYGSANPALTPLCSTLAMCTCNVGSAAGAEIHHRRSQH